MSWDHVSNPGVPARLQRTNTATAATHLGTHVASATLIGNSVDGVIILTADGTGGTTGLQATFTFPDITAKVVGAVATSQQGAVYSVTASVDSLNSTGTQTGTGLSAGIYHNGSSADPVLYVALSTGMAASQTLVICYHIARVG